MNITFVFPVPSLSGGCRVVAIYAQALADRGHKVTIVCPKYKYGGASNALKRLVGLSLSAKSRLANSHFSGLHGVSVLQLPPDQVQNSSKYPDSDVLVATWWKTVEWIDGFPVNKGKKCYFVQHYEVHEEQPKQRVIDTYKTEYPKIVIAEWLRRTMGEVYGAKRMCLVPNAVDHDQFFRVSDIQVEPFTVCSMYSESRFKGVDVTLDAFSRVRKNYPEAKLVLFGAKMPAVETNLPPGVEFVVSPDRSTLRKIYSSSRAYIFSSRSEGFGLPVLEALACGCPVIATNAGCAPEFITPTRNGFLNEIDDVAGQAKAIGHILAMNTDDWQRMSKWACDSVKECSWLRSSTLFESALSDIANAVDGYTEEATRAVSPLCL